MWNSRSENFISSSLQEEPQPIGGESLTVEQAIANLESADLGLRFYAAWWLGRFRVREEAAIEGLIKALDDEADRTPEGGYPLRRNAARALGKLGAQNALPALIKCLDCSDFYVREAAAQSLEMLGNPSCIPDLNRLLAEGLDTEKLVLKQSDFSQPYDSVLEALGTLQATESIPLVQPFLDHSIERVQYAAARAMYQLTQESIYGERLVQALSGDNLQLRRAALADLGAIGYFESAEAIAQTLAENSLKLIALKGLLEHQVKKTESATLSAATIKIMNLMDSLL
ncbi:HEAT repeat domain-containing protein [Aetokthonos hydrillicola Thurmond2011]|jgi:phycocyanobilin lyase alpha subunit|uniref:HEAT repeat domain-containing protein n=1 Tax=Aetokthonos hydrillicola Thurmond2011 TaxID=2712845 RepID=A0AAP5I6A7_9CYAN|nr:HEAT repeat domain-containing protein [Aetokthonos hydrillicola]MBO3461255.1 HEAT repeat domain-containing protein [Aetokthonos hydrillicola CCALA 1050]MBW4583698.1 HEAT repeat domain-containing protein [Aetokthonos hydrillicola CCALA 1050]MDR9895606.1 HEAT repeat domain-containing protein [Aetokthonos hydrillicola Thurmond2011]